MNLVFNSSLVITDSGGIQEETSYLGIPCLTVRKNTERPITVTQLERINFANSIKLNEKNRRDSPRAM